MLNQTKKNMNQSEEARLDCILWERSFTDNEKAVLEHLVKAHNEFVKLKVQHPNDVEEWCDKLHDLQRIIMSRIAVRAYPDYFTNIQKPSPFD